MRNQQFFSLFELNLAIRRLLDELNDREFKRLPGTRRRRFEELDQSVLQPLPATAYEYAEWRKARVGIDYHIEVERHFYSVPAAFVKREVEVRLTARTIECFSGGKRIAVHARSRLAGSHSTQAEHLPKAHRAHLEHREEQQRVRSPARGRRGLQRAQRASEARPCDHAGEVRHLLYRNVL